MRMLFFLTALLILSMIYFVGCSSDDWIIEGMYIQGIEISISESRPAHVMIIATGFHRNTCVSLHEIHHARKGNTISIWGTQSVAGSGAVCGELVTEVQGQVSIGELAVGEYKVIASDLELIFHIEEDESWLIRSPLIKRMSFSISESVPAQVIVNVEGYVCRGGIPFLETHQRQEEDTIYIQMTGKVPSSIRCPLVIHSDALIHPLSSSFTKYQNQISIGEFTPGNYRVVINGIERSFFIR